MIEHRRLPSLGRRAHAPIARARPRLPSSPARVCAAAAGAAALLAGAGLAAAPAAESTGARTTIRDRTATVGVGALVAPGLVLAGGTLRFHFEVANGAVVPGVHVRVCNELGGELALVSAPRAHVGAHEACWSIPSLIHGAPRQFALSARVAPGAHPGAVLHDSVRVTGANVIAHSVDVTARVLPPLSACAARVGRRPTRAHAAC